MDDDDKKILKKVKTHKKESIRGLPWKEMKKKAVIDALLRHDGHQTNAAKELGISRIQMWRYCKEYGLN
jgi:transcriptional regulator of acetoin/glycerol metabolism